MRSTTLQSQGAITCLKIGCILLLATLHGGNAAHAAGTSDNALLIIDPRDPISLQVGNYYKQARKIPDANVLYMSSAASSYDTFVARNQAAFLGLLGQRGIEDHIDYVVLAPLSTHYVPVPATLISGSACGSPITRIGISTLYTMALSPFPQYASFAALKNDFYGGTSYPPTLPALAFDGRATYWEGTASWHGTRYYLASVLGVTQGGVQNTVPEYLSMIDRSVAADGAHPSGTFYFMNNAGAVRNVRACGSGSCTTAPLYEATRDALTTLGASAQVLAGALPPTGGPNILGIMSGFSLADIPAANLSYAPGAFADHLTSGAAYFSCTPPVCQTMVSEWIRAGASGSAGTVEEPCAVPAKFPASNFHWYYAQGMSMGESYLRSMQKPPIQSILYGDPLTRPFAHIPAVTVPSPPGGTVTGSTTITPVASTSQPGAAIAGYDLLVDGIKLASVGAGQSFILDTTQLGDGRHDLRVLAYDNSAVRNVGRWRATLDTLNYGRSATLGVAPAAGSLAQNFTFNFAAAGAAAKEVRLMQGGRVVAASTAATGTFTAYGQNLGAGVSDLKLEVSYNDGRRASSIPVAVNVSATGSPVGSIPIAYGYSKILSKHTAHVVELPASYDSPPAAATYTLLGTPTQSTVVQSGATLPYVILKPHDGATGSEPLLFRVSTPGGTSTASVTLVYELESTLQFSAQNYEIMENATGAIGHLPITVTRSGSSFGTVGVTWSTYYGSANDFDFIEDTGTLTWGPGDTSPKTFLATFVDDANRFEGPEVFNIALSSPTGPAVLGQSYAYGIIHDDETPSIQFASTNYNVGESAGGAVTTTQITVIRTLASFGAVNVNWSVGLGSATDLDVLEDSGTLHWDDGDMSPKTFGVTIVNDETNEENEVANLALSMPTGHAVIGSPATAYLTIVDDD